uniref:Uncharacterized protein n=1 Tax=Panagrolaimus sp. JU765 TaxID=591449 RepID=A0AC34Q5W6_9BILA
MAKNLLTDNKNDDCKTFGMTDDNSAKAMKQKIHFLSLICLFATVISYYSHKIRKSLKERKRRFWKARIVFKNVANKKKLFLAHICYFVIIIKIVINRHFLKKIIFDKC